MINVTKVYRLSLNKNILKQKTNSHHKQSFHKNNENKFTVTENYDHNEFSKRFKKFIITATK